MRELFLSGVALSLCLILASCSQGQSPADPVNQPPTNNISSPSDSSTFTFGDSIGIVADASDLDGSIIAVEFFVNDRLEFTDEQEPFVYNLSHIAYRIGTHTVKAVARNEEDLVAVDSIHISIEALIAPVYQIEVKNAFDHDENAFTQGLVFEDGFLYEGTGIRGLSSIRKVELETGNVLMKRDLPAQYFGEGITIWEDKIVQLTWTSRTGFVYSKSDFDSLTSFTYSAEGWGLTNDEKHLIMSSGSPIIRFLDPESFEVVKTVEEYDPWLASSELNELEYIDGDLFANVYLTNYIVRISPETGHVVGWIDLTSIAELQTMGVPNGIAYDDIQDRLFLTGKRWTKVYEVKLIPCKNCPPPSR